MKTTWNSFVFVHKLNVQFCLINNFINNVLTYQLVRRPHVEGCTPQTPRVSQKSSLYSKENDQTGFESMPFSERPQTRTHELSLHYSLFGIIRARYTIAIETQCINDVQEAQQKLLFICQPIMLFFPITLFFSGLID